MTKMSVEPNPRYLKWEVVETGWGERMIVVDVKPCRTFRYETVYILYPWKKVKSKFWNRIRFWWLKFRVNTGIINTNF